MLRRNKSTRRRRTNNSHWYEDLNLLFKQYNTDNENAQIQKSPLELLDPTLAHDQTSNSKQVDQQLTTTGEEKKGILEQHTDVPGDDSSQGESGSGSVGSLDHQLDSTKSESENMFSSQDHTSAISVQYLNMLVSNCIGSRKE